MNDRSAAISPSSPTLTVASATSPPVKPAQQPGAARTKLLLEGPILPTLLRLSAPNILNLLAFAASASALVWACSSSRKVSDAALQLRAPMQAGSRQMSPAGSPRSTGSASASPDSSPRSRQASVSTQCSSSLR